MVKNMPVNAGDAETQVQSLGQEWQLTPILLPGKLYGQRNLAGDSPWVFKESDTNEQLSTPQPCK